MILNFQNEGVAQDAESFNKEVAGAKSAIEKQLSTIATAGHANIAHFATGGFTPAVPTGHTPVATPAAPAPMTAPSPNVGMSAELSNLFSELTNMHSGVVDAINKHLASKQLSIELEAKAKKEFDDEEMAKKAKADEEEELAKKAKADAEDDTDDSKDDDEELAKKAKADADAELSKKN
jgi:hypothetical protein